MGGKSFGTRLLLERNPEGVEPLSPENLFIIALGPVSDTRTCRILTWRPLSCPPSVAIFKLGGLLTGSSLC